MLQATHTQLDNNGLDNQLIELSKLCLKLNTLMDPTQFPSMRPTELTLTEIKNLLKFWAQSSQPNNKDGNPKVTLTTGPLKILLDNKDSQMKSTHGTSHLLSITTSTSINLNPCTPPWCNSKITKLINHSTQQKLLPLKWLPLNKLLKPKRLPMLLLEMPPTPLRPTLLKMPLTLKPSNLDGGSVVTLE